MDHDDLSVWDMFADIAAINAWLDRENASMDPDQDSLMRVLKIAEELGEASAAYIGYTGQNPRKGQTHSLTDLLAELADVAVTALAAIQHFTGDPERTRAILAAKVTHIITRSRIMPAPGMVPLVPASEVASPDGKTVPRM